MPDNEFELQESLAGIEARKVAFEKSPICFIMWDWGHKILGIVFCILFWGLVAQCHCSCIWNAKT